MNDVAKKFASAPPAPPVRKGPAPRCQVYGTGDIKLYRILHERRYDGQTWAQVQATLDGILGTPKKIDGDNFRYHWAAKCGHWDAVRDEVDRIDADIARLRESRT